MKIPIEDSDRPSRLDPAPDVEDDLAFWKHELAGAPTLLDLPTDRQRPATRRKLGRSASFSLPGALSPSLRALTREEDATLFATLLAAWAALLSRYTSQRDVVVGTRVAFNTLALRLNLDGNPSFRQFLHRVKQTTLAAFAHQQLPFTRVVQAIAPSPSPSYAPLVQVMFGLGAANLTEPTDPIPTELDLSLTLREVGDALEGQVEYDPDLFDAATIERLTVHYHAMLSDAAARPDVAVGALDFIDERERNQLVVTWNDTTRPYPRDACIHELFEAQVDRAPDAIAVRFEGAELTYRELDRRANQLAHRLRTMGVVAETLVGLCVERSLDLIIGIVGILKAGGAHVALDPRYPRDRLAFMMEDTRVPVLVTVGRLAGVLPAHEAQVVQLDVDLPLLAQESDARLPLSTHADHLSNVTFTSGSTGRPKGACTRHRGIVRLILGTNYFSVRPDDVVLQLLSTSVDASAIEVWAPLLRGARIEVFPPRTPTFDELGRFIVERGVSAALLMTGVFHQMVEHCIDDLRGLRCLMTGGDVVSVAHAQRVVAETNVTLLVLYGCTEDAVVSSWWRVPRSLAGYTSVPIGQPIANTTMFVLDADGRLTPIGIPGELYLGGDGLARGYLNRPELTAEKFVKNPFAPGLLYRTGDLVRRRADGDIEFLGRIDQQVKIRGFRIELGEIESVIAQLDGVRQVVVLAREDIPGDRRLVAYLVGDLDVGALGERIKQQLPDYMVPSAFVALETMPVTNIGKIDRQALPAPIYHDATSFVPPRTATESALADIWRDFLRVERVGVDDNFFRMGGHSLTALQLVARVRTVFEVELTHGALAVAPTLGEFAKRIDDERASPGLGAALLARVDRASRLPLSFAQEHYLGSRRVVTVAIPFRISGALRVDLLESALSELVRRHESLRTTYQADDAGAFQRIEDPFPVRVELEDLCTLADDVRLSAATERIQAEIAVPFDRTHGPLFRTRLLRFAPQEHILVLLVDHIACDGTISAIVERDLRHIYHAFASGRPLTLPELPIQIADFAAWQRQRFSPSFAAAQVEYWLRELGDAPRAIALPFDHAPGPEVRTESVFVTIEGAQLQSLLDSAARGGGLFGTLWTALVATLFEITGQRDLVIGTVYANRDRDELTDTIGCIINFLAIRVRIEAEATTLDALRARVQRKLGNAFERAELPHVKVIEAIAPPITALGRPRLTNVVLQLDWEDPSTTDDLDPRISQTKLPVSEGPDRVDLRLYVKLAGRHLEIDLRYDAHRFDRGTIERIGQHYRQMLDRLRDDPSSTLDRRP